jgi:diguanylate cyclase (GGDEF)-like protein
MSRVDGSARAREQRLEPVRGRTPARVVVAALLFAIAVTGIWGAITTARTVDSYDHAKRLESALQQARYALALERTAISEDGGPRAGQDLAASAGSFAADVRLVARAGGGADKALASRLRERQHALLAATRAATDSPTVGLAEDSQQLARARAAQLDRTLVRSLAVASVDPANSWPRRPIQKIQLASVLVLVALGLASAAVFLLRVAGYRRRLVRARRENIKQLERAARSDNLTGLGNHRAFYEDVRREISRRAETGSSFAIVMLDLDGLKQINDTLGHQAGDDGIRAVARSLRASLRVADSAYRTGGDEFMVLLPGERAFGGLVFAQRLQAEIVQTRKAITVSCGVTEAEGLESARSLTRRADLALYEAKRTGRRVVVYSDGISPRPTDRPEDLALRRHHRLLATALAQAVDAKDVGTRNHCETVSALCVLIGQSLGLGGERLEQLRLAGLLHDVGKIGIADALLQKPWPLDSDERSAMSGHVQIGQTIVAAAGLQEEAEWILHHHEHFDGTGYPNGLRSAEIPLESRIILAADAFEAMTADRPYRAARRPSEALAELERHAGGQFDASVVEALRLVLDSGDELSNRRAARSTLSPDLDSPESNIGPQVAQG